MFATHVCRPVFRPVMKGNSVAAAALFFLLVPLVHHPLLAQGLDREEAIDAIVGSDVKTEETTKEAQIERVVAALRNTRESAELVRKTFNLDTLEIVYLPDLGEENGVIEQAIMEQEDQIQTLHESIEGSAMFYHAIDSRSILLRDIVAVEFADNNTVTIFVKGEAQ
ncbi:hypothetical protein [Chelativorans sp. Marseille-P2723]|uniref:hypothetical protein n=1 Tax=Chelativorans sp. Marseille-P2723 TaxID=2709133 RepID=UPI00156EBCF3|nr:hypothetical protein [Chelativorans sp. Marseille-P2723]